jgi:hypothetical protein
MQPGSLPVRVSGALGQETCAICHAPGQDDDVGIEHKTW